MKITLSDNLSYCVGVHRTLDLVEEVIAENPGKLYYMLGEIVHNEHVINRMKSLGLRIIHSLEEIDEPGTVIIQSHGAPQRIFAELERRKIPYIDATCPMVSVIHRRLQKLEEEGYFPAIIGQRGHDEVSGIAGQVRDALIFGSPEEVTEEALAGRERVGIVVQSTFIRAEALAVVAKIKAIVNNVNFIDTICRPTTERQTEITRVAGEFDIILIIGSRTSANTRHLFHLASGKKSRVFLVDDPESVRDLPLSPGASIFIASGASTPMTLIDRVVEVLEGSGS
jgi:4-hydroxy-3-methylbut-2-enyl diphosphate reductase